MVLLLLLSVFVVWCAAQGRTNAKAWATPLNYGDGDNPYALCWFKAAAEGDFVPFASRTIHRLDAPFGANWNDWPMFEQPLIFLMGLVTRYAGLVSAAQTIAILSHLTSALAFYLCCRLLRFHRPWSFAAALLWSFSYFHLNGALGHWFLCFDWTIPLGVVCCWFNAAGREVRLGGRVFWLGCLAAVGIGLGNPYNLCIYGQLLVLSTAIRMWLRRNPRELIPGCLFLALTSLAFFASNYPVFHEQWLHGNNSQPLVRPYQQTEVYALKPMELFIPPASHRVQFLGDIGRKYATNAYVVGEMFMPYLGLVAFAALLWMAFDYLCLLARWRRAPDSRKGAPSTPNTRSAKFSLRVVAEVVAKAFTAPIVPRRLPLHFPWVIWIGCFSIIGGLNCVIGLFGLTVFRGSSRFSLFILCLCLLFLASRLSRITRGWSLSRKWVFALILAGLGLLDQLPPTPSAAAIEAVSRKMDNDREFCAKLEQWLPPNGMVFQLPVMQFNENGPVEGCAEYDLMRPYLWTDHLRFSYGWLAGRPREVWQDQAARLKPAMLARGLELAGFSGLYLNRKGFTDQGAGLLKELAAAGHTQIVEDQGGEQVCVRLNPSPTPVIPHTDDAALICYTHGWAFTETFTNGAGFAHWANGDSSLYFFSEAQEPTTFRLTGKIVSLSPRQVSIEYQRRTLWQQELQPEQEVSLDLELTGDHGRNYVYFKTDRPAEAPSTRVRVAEGVINLQIAKPRARKP